MRFSVLTPTYNRSHLLRRLFESLLKQTFRDFEWIIVDDGSLDDTPQLIHRFQEGHTDFEIHYVQQKNGGKHRAINNGMSIAKGELIFIADSDDWLPRNALDICDRVEKSIPNYEKKSFAGICGADGYADGSMVGATFNDSHYLDITSLQRPLYGISGDKKEVFYADVLRQYPFPEYEGEKFISESVVWNRIAKAGLKLRFFNDIIYQVEYQSDGISALQGKYFVESPNGWALAIKEEIENNRLDFINRWNLRYGFYGSLRHKYSICEIAEFLEVNTFNFFLMMKFIRLKNGLLSHKHKL